LGLATIAHAVPFHRSISVFASRTELEVELPTAKQFVALEHVTATRTLEAALATFGLTMMDHDDPFQRSTSVLTVELDSADPTAKQLVPDGHHTPLRPALVAPAGLGTVTIDHAVPFQRSANGVAEKGPSIEPTAMQLVAVAHATLRNPEPFWLVVAWIDQLVPFQCSMNAVLVPPFWFSPVAKQFVSLGHAIDRSTLISPTGFGLVWIDQLVPFQCSISVFTAPAVPTRQSPTAKQLVDVGQVMPDSRT